MSSEFFRFAQNKLPPSSANVNRRPISNIVHKYFNNVRQRSRRIGRCGTTNQILPPVDPHSDQRSTSLRQGRRGRSRQAMTRIWVRSTRGSTEALTHHAAGATAVLIELAGSSSAAAHHQRHHEQQRQQRRRAHRAVCVWPQRRRSTGQDPHRRRRPLYPL